MIKLEIADWLNEGKIIGILNKHLHITERIKKSEFDFRSGDGYITLRGKSLGLISLHNAEREILDKNLLFYPIVIDSCGRDIRVHGKISIYDEEELP